MAAIRRTIFVLLACAAAVPAAAQTWPAGGLTLRTNGSVLRAGECVRLALLALDEVPGPLVPTVRYAFRESITVKDQDGKEQSSERPSQLVRPTGAVIERLSAGSSIVLDDTFCFGQRSLAGPYELTVSLGSGSDMAETLITCVEYHPDETGASPAPVVRCELGLRGVSRRDESDLLTMEGQFPSTALYRLAFLRGDRLVHLMEDSFVAVGSRELTFVVPPIGSDADSPVDLVLHDQATGRSTSLARVSLKR